MKADASPGGRPESADRKPLHGKPAGRLRSRHVFGPVFSRRLGRSLGVDLVPYKTCSYDCIYCQLGQTTNKTVERQRFISIPDVLREIEARLDVAPTPDYVTLSGSGEPTLHAGLDELITGIKRITRLPVALLTNGSLLWREDLQQELLGLDLIVPSLDAGDDAMFQCVNRPHAQLSFAQLIVGLAEFRRRFHGQFWLEVFLLQGLTTAAEQIAKIGGLAARCAPDRIQLNTVTRPPCEACALPATAGQLAHGAKLLGMRAEVIADRVSRDRADALLPQDNDILALLRRRPCTLEEVAAGLGVHRLELAKQLERLLHARAVATHLHGQRIFFRVAGGAMGGADGGRGPEDGQT